MGPDDAPDQVPKITLPAWAYVALIVFGNPIAVAYLTGGDVKAALVSSIITASSLVGYRQAVLVPQTKAAALAHREFNLGAGYAQAENDAKPAKKTTPRKKAP